MMVVENGLGAHDTVEADGRIHDDYRIDYLRKPKKEIHLTSYEELLGIEDNQENSVDKITEIPIDCLYGFKNHPFYVINDEKMQETVDSIKEYGVLNPCIVRPREGGGYEIISGHRRKYACQLAGKAKIPAIIRNYTDDEATIIMVDSVRP